MALIPWRQKESEWDSFRELEGHSKCDEQDV